MFGTIFAWIKEYGTLLLELIKQYGLKAGCKKYLKAYIKRSILTSFSFCG